MIKVPPDRRQVMLLPPSVDEYVSAAHRVRVIVEVVERLDAAEDAANAGAEPEVPEALADRKRRVAAKAKEHAKNHLQRTAAAEVRAEELLKSADPAQRAAGKTGLKRASKDSSVARACLRDAEAEQLRQSTKPREIYVRDTTRDGIATAAKLTDHMLIEYVLREYFGNLRMEARTFIESVVNLPVTIRTTETETIY